MRELCRESTDVNVFTILKFDLILFLTSTYRLLGIIRLPAIVFLILDEHHNSAANSNVILGFISSDAKM